MLFTSRNSNAKRVAIGFAMLLVLGLATEALAARKARATGFYRLGRGEVNLPMQFVITLGTGMTGNHSLALGFPNDDAQIDDDVTLLGMGVGAVSVNVPQNVVDGSYTALLPLMGTNNIQITTMFTVFRAPDATAGALFAPGGGPGPFTFCPVPAGMGGAASGCPAPPAAPQATGIGETRNGRVVYTGGSGFGGVSQVMLGGGGLVTRAAAVPHGFSATGMTGLWAAQSMFGGGVPTMAQVIGASAYNVNMLNGATYTRPLTVPGTASSIPGAAHGPGVTDGGAVTTCAATGPNLPASACVVGSGALKTAGAGTTTNTGFPFTTGTVLAQQTTGNDPDFFSITGSNGLDSLGIGNITLVAGGLALRTNQSGAAPGGSADTISLTISEKTPSMSAGGFAAAAVLMVLAAGYATRRRF